MIKWHSIKKAKRPPKYRLILVKFEAIKGMPECIVVAYWKNTYFVRMGAALANDPQIIEWCDCLPKGFSYEAIIND